jgi:hypothetical protein
MSWRTGSTLFLEIWPRLQTHIPDREMRVEFTAKLLQLFADEDMDTYDVEDVHPDIRAAIRRAGMEICEPDRYKSDPSD